MSKDRDDLLADIATRMTTVDDMVRVLRWMLLVARCRRGEHRQ